MGSRSECPKCCARRGLAEYDNGEFCHACHQIISSNKSLIKTAKKEKKRLEVPKISGVMPKDAYNWLFGYIGIEANDCFIFWSDEYQRIVFLSPSGKAAWMRSVNKQPKWLFVGDKDEVFYYPCRSIIREIEESESNRKCVCLVEDVVSAIKVSEVVDSITLGGTQIKDNVYSYIGNNGYQKVYIFLDGDEAGRKGAEFIRKRLALLCDTVIIRGSKDPKDCGKAELEGLLK